MAIQYQLQPKPKPVSKPATDDSDDEPDEVLRASEIELGPEMLRILAAPLRDIPDGDSSEAQRLADFLTDRLAKVAQPYPGRLRPLQAMALKEAWENQGFFGPLKPGCGKTLIAALLPTIFQLPAIYVCPASIQEDTEAEFTKMRRDWKVASKAQLQVISYQLLSSPSSGEERNKEGLVTQQSRLDRLKPKLLILDEGHSVAATSSTGTKRLNVYLRENPDVIVIAMSGTFFKTSIKNAAHIMKWCLKERAPLPNDFKERETWAALLDAKPENTDRPAVGAMQALVRRYGYTLDVEGCRMAVGRNIFETPGVIGTREPLIDVPLSMDGYLPEEECDDIHAAFDTLMASQCLPDGTELADKLAYSRHASTLGLGFWQKYTPDPPKQWRMTRNEWSKACRLKLQRNKLRIDSEARLKAAIRKGIFPELKPLLDAWEFEMYAERRRTGFRDPPVECVWVSNEAIDEVATWAHEYQGVIWVKHVGLGEKLSATLKIPYYGEGTIDKKTGRRITEHKSGPAVASLYACGTGVNLQRIWHSNLWLCAPTEQALARTHRPGQTRPVSNHVYLGCMAHLKSLSRAVDVKAAFTEQLTGDSQRLRSANTNMPTEWDLEKRGGSRWARK